MAFYSARSLDSRIRTRRLSSSSVVRHARVSCRLSSAISVSFLFLSRLSSYFLAATDLLHWEFILSYSAMHFMYCSSRSFNSAYLRLIVSLSSIDFWCLLIISSFRFKISFCPWKVSLITFCKSALSYAILSLPIVYKGISLSTFLKPIRYQKVSF